MPSGAGDQLPELKLSQVGDGEVELPSLYGSQASVVLFWHPDRWMSRMALTDLEREIYEKSKAAEVAVIGIVVETPEAKAQAAVKAAGASFPQLLDADGMAFAKVGQVMLPRIYVLDSNGKIVWFDIEYSESTRRELSARWKCLRRPNDKNI